MVIHVIGVGGVVVRTVAGVTVYACISIACNGPAARNSSIDGL